MYAVAYAVHFEAAAKLARALHGGSQLRKRLEKVSAAWAAAAVRLQQCEASSAAEASSGGTPATPARLFVCDVGEPHECV
jgi:hypothetical protein